MHRTYELAMQMLEAIPRAPATESGYRLFWVYGNDVSAFDLPARRDDYAIVGRHTHCDVLLSRDPEISLRHLLARTVVLADGTIALRFFDLHSAMPFFLEDGMPRRSIVASGPVMVRLGQYVLGGVPYGPATPRNADAGGGGGPYRSPPQYTVSESRVMPAASPGGERRSHITILPALPALDDFAWSAARPGNARVTLARAGQRASVELADADLEVGVLVGRSDKCVDRGLRAVMSESVSRAHLLLLREHEVVHAFDLCSMQGTYIDAMRVRRCRLPDTGATLRLATTDPVSLTWHPRVLV